MPNISTPIAQPYNGSQVTSFPPMTFGNSVAIGHTVLVFVSSNALSGSSGSFAATDSAGNSYVQDVYEINTGTAQGAILRAQSIASAIVGGTTTLTVTRPTGVGVARAVFIAREYDDVTGLDTGIIATNATGSGVNLTSGTTGAASQNRELVVGGFGWTGAVSDFTAGASFATPGPQQATNGTSYVNGVIEEQYVNTSGTRAATGTFGASKAFVGMVAAYKVSAPSQVGKPTSDKAGTGTGWTQVGGTGGALYSTLDETTADSSDYIQTPNNPTGQEYVTRIAAMATPTDPTATHILCQLWDVGVVGTNTWTVKVYDSDGTTVRATRTPTVTSSVTTYDFNLTTSESNSITGWGAGIYVGIAATLT